MYRFMKDPPVLFMATQASQSWPGTVEVVRRCYAIGKIKMIVISVDHLVYPRPSTCIP